MKNICLKTFNCLILFLLLVSCNKNESTPMVDPNLTMEYEMKIENDVKVSMRDGVVLSVNIYRPDMVGEFPVIMSMGPYGKDELPAEYSPEDGNIEISEYAAFETPDPAFWVKHGYVVIAADNRGTGLSEGSVNLLEDSEADDYYDLIEWAAIQDWASGKVGLNGVSYFGLNQWKVAALNPPHLSAIIVWEGFTDAYRDVFYHGGIPGEFIDLWFQFRILENLSEDNTGYRDLPTEVNQNPLSSAQVYKDLSSIDVLENISVPAYIAVSIQDHGLHTRGTILGFENINSQQKWLELYGRKKWEFYYSEDAQNRQKLFFDHFLKEVDDSILDQPEIRYEMRESYYEGEIETASNWPIPGRTLEKLFLDAAAMTLDSFLPSTSEEVSYDATHLEDPEEINASQQLIFKHIFVEETKIVGSMKLKLFVSTDEADDIDLFVGIQKANAEGDIVYLQGPGEEEGQVASGWLRISKRVLDENLSTEEIPFHRHDIIEKVQPNEIVEVEIELWPTTIKYAAGEQLLVVIQGNDIIASQESHKDNVNQGNTSIYTGGQYDSYLQIPTL